MPIARPLLATGLLALAAAVLATSANAQQVFRIVTPDGRITYSDRAPAEPQARAAATAIAPGSGADATAALPFELRQATSRYPVMLYTSPSCGPCGTGRSFLTSRGIPFSEKTVTTNQDIEALQRLNASASLPSLSIGAQQLSGYSEVEWGQFLDAAGYPKTSQLPPGFRHAPATPLVAAQAPAPIAARETQRPAAAPPPVPSPAPDAASNPAGIKF